MAISLYTGGCRSGKSRLALEYAASLAEKVCFIATCVPQDDEMRSRVERHKRERPEGWKVIEEPLALAESIVSVDPREYPVILVDCLTLWICNLMNREDSPTETEAEMARQTRELVAAARSYGKDVVFVSNEVGMGIMPANAMARKYGDLVGRCNQVVAAGADRVIFAACGIGVELKIMTSN